MRGVRGVFEIDPALPAEFKTGVFQPGLRYPVWIRLSNSAPGSGPDKNPTSRGFAMKLLDVQTRLTSLGLPEDDTRWALFPKRRAVSRRDDDAGSRVEERFCRGRGMQSYASRHRRRAWSPARGRADAGANDAENFDNLETCVSPFAREARRRRLISSLSGIGTTIYVARSIEPAQTYPFMHRTCLSSATISTRSF